MSDPQSPLRRTWHFALLLLGITIALTIAVWLLSKIWLIVLVVLLAGAAIYVGILLLQRHFRRW